MSTKSSTGRPGRYPQGPRRTSERQEGSGQGWSDSDASLIAGHYLANLLLCRPSHQPPRSRRPAVVRRARQALGGYARRLIGRLKRLWALVKGLLGAGDQPLAAAGSYGAVDRRAHWVARHHERGRR